GHWLAAGLEPWSLQSRVIVWDTTADGDPKSFDYATDFQFGADGTSIMTFDGRRLTVFDIATGQQLRGIDVPSGPDYVEFRIDPTGTMAMLIPLTHPRIDVIDLASGDIRGSIDVRNPWSARFSPDGSLVAVAGDDGVIQVHDTQTWT